ncbi:MAG: GAF domain-containing protein [Ignavibacteriales bacterium]|nr:hypothetical protein [Ignavibacteriaceae bacterium]MBW7872650.1 GAF domain-containing protein [Ignavibacteria bacterium]MBZ0196832.1 GAF domain-containing protein [Ignavibacteriaceae bacterium]MCZ2141796.1 GAF domain-containing protein [Ignavibacteriales bacterium]WKZ71346.1 MAG: GAF domain-containing protein [Ignavibacteriaceae bacterium]
MNGYRSILLFSDNPETIDIYSEFARKADHDLLHLAKSQQSLREISSKTADLIFVEISQPSMAEIEFVDALHSQSENTPIMIVSSFFYETREIVFGDKISDFIRNPLTVEKLEETTAGFFSKSAAKTAAPEPESKIERLMNLNKRLTVLLELNRSLTSITDLDELLAHIIKVVPDVLMAERATVFINDKEKGELWSRTGTGLKASDIRFPNNQGIAGEVFTSGVPLTILEPYDHPKFNKEFDLKSGFKTLNILACPLKNINAENIGVIQLLNKKEGKFNSDDETYLAALASGIGIVLENALLRDKMKKQLEEVNRAYKELDIAQETILKETRMATISEFYAVFSEPLTQNKPLNIIADLKNDYPYDSQLVRKLEVLEDTLTSLVKNTEAFTKQYV